MDFWKQCQFLKLFPHSILHIHYGGWNATIFLLKITLINQLLKKLLNLMLPKIIVLFIFYLLLFTYVLSWEDISYVLLWSIAWLGFSHSKYLLVMVDSSWSNNQFQFHFLALTILFVFSFCGSLSKNQFWSPYSYVNYPCALIIYIKRSVGDGSRILNLTISLT